MSDIIDSDFKVASISKQGDYLGQSRFPPYVL